MKKLYKILWLVLIITACNEDFTFKFQDKVAFKEDEIILIEGEIQSLELQLVGAQRPTPIQVTFATSGTAVNGQDYFVGGTTVTIPANSSVGFIDLSSKDNSVVDDTVKTIILTITNVSEGIGTGHDAGVDAEGKEFDEENGKSITISICDDEALIDLTGVYDTTTSGCAGDNNGGCATNFIGLIHVVTVTLINGRDYLFSDITGGLYPLPEGYQASDQPATVRDDCNILSLESQPDTVFGGDEFNGTGKVNPDGNLELNWSNGFGDQGRTVFTKR